MKTLTHKATVIEEDTGSGLLAEVKRTTACSECHQNTSCGVLEAGSIFLRLKSKKPRKKGEEITIVSSRKELYLSMLVIYVIPVVLMLSTTFISASLRMPQMITALATIAVPTVYFITLRIILMKWQRPRYRILED